MNHEFCSLKHFSDHQINYSKLQIGYKIVPAKSTIVFIQDTLGLWTMKLCESILVFSLIIAIASP